MERLDRLVTQDRWSEWVAESLAEGLVAAGRSSFRLVEGAFRPVRRLGERCIMSICYFGPLASLPATSGASLHNLCRVRGGGSPNRIRILSKHLDVVQFPRFLKLPSQGSDNV